MYQVHLSQRVDKFLQKLDKHISVRITERLKNLAAIPIPSDAKFISREGNEKVFRYRVGDFRALYTVDDNNKIVLIVKLDKRPRIYQR